MLFPVFAVVLRQSLILILPGLCSQIHLNVDVFSTLRAGDVSIGRGEYYMCINYCWLSNGHPREVLAIFMQVCEIALCFVLFYNMSSILVLQLQNTVQVCNAYCCIQIYVVDLFL